jgi:hypothetical protein
MWGQRRREWCKTEGARVSLALVEQQLPAKGVLAQKTHDKCIVVLDHPPPAYQPLSFALDYGREVGVDPPRRCIVVPRSQDYRIQVCKLTSVHSVAMIGNSNWWMLPATVRADRYREARRSIFVLRLCTPRAAT